MKGLIYIILLIVVATSCKKELDPSKIEVLIYNAYQDTYQESYIDTTSTVTYGLVDYGGIDLTYKLINYNIFRIQEYEIYFRIVLTNDSIFYFNDYGYDVRDETTVPLFIETNGYKAKSISLSYLHCY